jgi:hypothetical protein
MARGLGGIGWCGVAGAFSLIFQAIAVLVFPISYAIFSFFYSMYGAVLYLPARPAQPD